MTLLPYVFQATLKPKLLLIGNSATFNNPTRRSPSGPEVSHAGTHQFFRWNVDQNNLAIVNIVSWNEVDIRGFS